VRSRELFWALFWTGLICGPLISLCLVTLRDIFGRAMPGWVRALWCLAVIGAPLVGTLAYLLLRRPAASTRASRAGGLAPTAGRPARANSAAARLGRLAQLHDAGKLSDAEFAAAKARLLGSADLVAPGGPAAEPPACPEGAERRLASASP
jgi:Short C-terminal domain